MILLVACSGSGPAEVEPAAPADPAVDAGWIPALMAAPASFDALVAEDHAGWVAVHAGDWRATGAAPGPQARLRERRGATLDHALRLHVTAWDTLAARWETRGAPGEAAVVRAVARAARVDAGLPPDPQAPPATGARLSPDAAALSAWSGELDPPEMGPLTGCLRIHHAARASGGPASCPALAALTPPLPDPFAVQTARLTWRAGPGQGPVMPDNNLQHAVFSERWLGGPAEIAGGALGPALGLDLSGAADAQAVRDAVHAMDGALDTAAARWRSAAPAEGRALESELDLVGLWRSRALTAAAADLLGQDRPEPAAAALQLALDATQGRALSPRNTPELRLLAAEAALRTGRSREALDALAPLRAAWPEVQTIVDIIDDVVVLESLGRVGESHEH